MRKLLYFFLVLLLTSTLFVLCSDDETDDGNGTGTIDLCGNAVVDGEEECDDGNAVEGGVGDDTCNTDCTQFVPPGCGNAILDEGEECDDGTGSPGSEVPADSATCNKDCTLVECGDLYINTVAEACDDGNVYNGDGCSDACVIEELCAAGKTWTTASVFNLCTPSGTEIQTPSSGTVLGSVAQDYDLDKALMRGGETPWNNLWLDAGFTAAVDEFDTMPNFYWAEAGGFRIKQPNPDWATTMTTDVGKLSSGTQLTSDFVGIVLFPFPNQMMTKKVTLAQIVQALEIGATGLPNTDCGTSGNGQLIQTSQELRVAYDMAGVAYASGVSEGERVLTVSINGELVFNRNKGGYVGGATAADEYVTASDNYFLNSGATGGAQSVLQALSVLETSADTPYAVDFKQGIQANFPDKQFTSEIDGRMVTGTCQ